ncbi:MAG: hypothetical protein ACHQ5A_03360 [Opitutales bacterium]
MSAPVAPDRSDRHLTWVFGAMLLGTLWMLSRSWHASILDRYEFRQLQTALSAYWMRQDGFRFDYLTPLFGPPWSIPMEFPTYQMCVAGLSGLTHWPLEQTGRLVGILFFLATLPAVYDLLGLAGLTRSRRLLALSIILSTPVYLFYTRTVMIETTALCFSVWFVCVLRRMLDRGSWALLPAAVLLALLAALTKITTFAVYCVPAGLLTLGYLLRPFHQPRGHRLGPALRTGLLASLPVALALVVTAAWVAHGDAVKNSNPFTGFLNSTELHRWNYGAPGLRLEYSFWQHAGESVVLYLLSEGGLALALLCTVFAAPVARRAALVGLAGFAAGPLIFANLYHVHDYYYTANALLLTGSAGLLLASAWDNPRLAGGARWLILGLTLAFQFHAMDRTYNYYYWKEAPPPPDLAAVLRETVPADGVILIYGADWNPLLPYYAQRRALMVPGDRDDETALLEGVIARLPPYHIAAMVTVGDKVRHRPDFLRERTRRFGFAPQPFATSADADLYLPASAISSAAARLQERKFSTARVLVTARSTLADTPEQNLAGLSFPMASPAPLGARSRFGISLGEADGRHVINAHAPSEIYIAPPAGATHITAIVGLAPSAYAKPLPEASDGIVVEIFEEQPDGLRRSLLRRPLSPATITTDRGPQELTYDHGAPFTGRIVFSIDPGPAGNIAYDQAYWAKIEVR